MLTFESSETPVSRKIKMLIYGGPGTGKTHFALHAPAPLVIDTESSTDAFRGRADFPVFWVAKSAEPKAALEVLEALQHKGTIQGITPESLIVDSFSVLWHVRQEAGQKKAEYEAEKKKYSAETARVSFYDWSWIKRPIQRLFSQLINMPVNVVLTAREKPVYEEVQDGNQRKLEIVDYTPDIERNAEYVFDIVLRLYVENGVRYAQVRKSRFPQFTIGQIIENPKWEMFADLTMTGVANSITPDLESAAEAESEPDPAAWVTESGLEKFRAYWANELLLSETEVRAALGCAPDRITYSAAEAKARVDNYITAQLANDPPAVPTQNVLESVS